MQVVHHLAVLFSLQIGSVIWVFRSVCQNYSSLYGQALVGIGTIDAQIRCLPGRTTKLRISRTFIVGDYMLRAIKEFIKTKPRVYDFFNAKRKISDDVEIWIDKFSKQNEGNINFIQVGASDGLRWDPVRRFVLRDKWKGVLIEPLNPVYKMLKNNYSYVNRGNLFFENCAISEKKGASIDFWSYSDDFLNSLALEDKLYYLRKSSLDKKQVEQSLVDVKGGGENIMCYTTPCKSLSEIINKYFPNNKVDLIFIDAEGYDDYVIRTIDFDKCMPRAILYESHNLCKRNEEIEDYLSKKGYVITKLGGDTVAQLNSNSSL